MPTPTRSLTDSDIARATTSSFRPRPDANGVELALGWPVYRQGCRAFAKSPGRDRSGRRGESLRPGICWSLGRRARTPALSLPFPAAETTILERLPTASHLGQAAAPHAAGHPVLADATRTLSEIAEPHLADVNTVRTRRDDVRAYGERFVRAGRSPAQCIGDQDLGAPTRRACGPDGPWSPAKGAATDPTGTAVAGAPCATGPRPCWTWSTRDRHRNV